MSNVFKKLSIFITILLLLLSTVSCSSPETQDETSKISTSKENSEQGKFDKFTNELFVSEVQTNTINLHYTLSNPEEYDITDYPVTLGNYSVEYFKESNSDTQNTLNQLMEFNYDELSYNQQIVYDILYDYLSNELSSSDLYLYNEPLSSTLGDQAQLPVLLAEYTFNSKTDVEDYLKLISEIKSYFNQLIEFENEKVNAGLFMSDDMVDAIITQCSKFIENPQQNYLIEIFNEKIDSLNILSEEEKIQYKEKNSSIILNDLIESYKYLIEELTKLKGNGKNSGGLCNFENGKEYYEYLIKQNTGSSKSVTALTSMVKSKIKSDLKEMSTLIIDNPDLINNIDNYSFSVTKPEDIITTLIKNIEKDFPSAPDVNYNFKYVHESLEDDLSPAFYLMPPIDDYKNNIIYINESDKYSGQDLFTTIAHEGYPGHLYQTTYFDSTNPAPVRSLLNYSGYVEGWATYTEIYSYTISGLDEDVAKFLALNTSYALGIYSRIDIGVNYEGWTLEDVSEYLKDIGITDINICTEIFNSMIECPGNYLNYYIGYLEILELKDIARESLGDSFNLKDFHEFILEVGPAPFDVILKYLNIWLSNN